MIAAAAFALRRTQGAASSPTSYRTPRGARVVQFTTTAGFVVAINPDYIVAVFTQQSDGLTRIEMADGSGWHIEESYEDTVRRINDEESSAGS